MQIRVEKKSILDIDADIIIVNLFEGVTNPAGVTGIVDNAFGNIISNYVIGKEKFEGKFGEIYQLPLISENKKIFIVGLGKRENFKLSKIRDLSAKIIKVCNAQKVVSILNCAGVAGLCHQVCAQMIT